MRSAKNHHSVDSFNRAELINKQLLDRIPTFSPIEQFQSNVAGGVALR
jgi:hypothetical protein